MKPEWELSPPWAGYLCKGPDQKWYWLENKPRLYASEWIFDGAFQFASHGEIAWSDSLEKRP